LAINKAMTTYNKSAEAVSIGDSFTDNWQYESDTLKRIKDRMAETFPKSNRRDVVPDGEFKSGMKRWTWYLVDTTDKENEKVIEKRYAMELISKKNNKPYFMINTYSLQI